ncbi:MAG: FliH/SctL family protein [Candidatus Gastranaerophilales bacterium]|nr:FliH/SctL family protein [Candidatus Gastranaerophilales bacterium]
MIIKKKRKSNDDDNKPKSSAAAELTESQNNIVFETLSDISDRQERRRGDRRRGYRRIEDRSLVSRAQEEANLIKEKAKKEGIQKGIILAQNEITELKKAVQSIMDVKRKAYETYQNDIAFIALDVAQKILQKEVQENPATIINIVNNVIKEISKDENRITIIVNPIDKDILINELNKQESRVKMCVETDTKIEQGSCRVITQSGQIDAAFSTQLQIIKKAFEEGL